MAGEGRRGEERLQHTTLMLCSPHFTFLLFYRAVHKFHKVLGFDWLLLFLQGHIHMETAMRALRLLVHILSDPVMFSKFREGDLAGNWLEGSEQFLLEAGSGLGLVGLQHTAHLECGQYLECGEVSAMMLAENG